mgnify:CR=1 FL=1
MTKQILYALILIGLVIIVLLFNSNDTTTVNLIFDKVRFMSSLVFLAFTAIGVVVGVLIK